MTEKKDNFPKFNQVVLLILDGWGLGRPNRGNPIHLAKTPFLDSFYRKYPWVKLRASGRSVGLPENQVGNSEAGHENLGGGRIVNQDVVKISQEITNGRFFKNSAFLAAIKRVKKNNSALHLIGMLSNGQSPHSDPDHLLALLSLARKKKVKKVFLHLFSDGRDSPPRSSLKSVMALERSLKPNELIATVIGRFYAMDRKKEWSRTIRAYNAMVGDGIEHRAKSPQEAIMRAYNANITDEFIEPVVIYHQGKMISRIADRDAVIFFNLRSDRARQLAKPFVQKKFEVMNPKAPKRKKKYSQLVFVAMTDFGPDLDSILTAYPSRDLKGTLPAVLEDCRQIYISEEEKYAHITYFFNGGYADPIAGEDRVNVPSPKVKSYAETPAMATAKIVSQGKKALRSRYNFICLNFAGPDMVGHTGDLAAGIKAAEAVDKNLKKLAKAIFWKKAGLIITADHGNLESMLNLKTKEIITEHTTNPVPLIVAGKGISKKNKLAGRAGVLGGVAPTVLNLLGIASAPEITEKSLIK